MSNERKFKGKATKKVFEGKIIAEHGVDGLTASPYDEMTAIDGEYVPVRMTLYYKNDVHVGTWQSGSGWFASALATV